LRAFPDGRLPVRNGSPGPPGDSDGQPLGGGGKSGRRSEAMATHQRIDVSKSGDVTVVTFLDKKVLDETGIQELGQELFDLVERDNRRQLLLNFENVEFISSATLGKLIVLDRKVKTHKGRLKMSNIRPEILEVFQITKLNKVFDIRDQQAEALAAFGQ
jgi:anti-sigma B factor antagonist